MLVIKMRIFNACFEEKVKVRATIKTHNSEHLFLLRYEIQKVSIQQEEAQQNAVKRK